MKSKIFFSRFLMAGLLIAFVFSSCHYNHNTSIAIKESKKYYQLSAHFDRNKTRDVQQYINQQLGVNSNFSFTNTRINRNIRMDDNTSFYIKSYPGKLKIKFNKNQNSEASYLKIKSLCEGINEVVH